MPTAAAAPGPAPSKARGSGEGDERHDQDTDPGCPSHTCTISPLGSRWLPGGWGRRRSPRGGVRDARAVRSRRAPEYLGQQHRHLRRVEGDDRRVAPGAHDLPPEILDVVVAHGTDARASRGQRRFRGETHVRHRVELFGSIRSCDPMNSGEGERCEKTDRAEHVSFQRTAPDDRPTAIRGRSESSRPTEASSRDRPNGDPPGGARSGAQCFVGAGRPDGDRR